MKYILKAKNFILTAFLFFSFGKQVLAREFTEKLETSIATFVVKVFFGAACFFATAIPPVQGLYAADCGKYLKAIIRAVHWKHTAFERVIDRSHDHPKGSLSEFLNESKLHFAASMLIEHFSATRKSRGLEQADPINPSAAKLYRAFSDYLWLSDTAFYARRSKAQVNQNLGPTTDTETLVVWRDSKGSTKEFRGELIDSLYHLLFDFLIEEIKSTGHPELLELADEVVDAYQNKIYLRWQLVDWLRSIVQLRTKNVMDVIRSLQELRATYGFLNTLSSVGEIKIAMSDETRLSNRQKLAPSYDFAIYVQEQDKNMWTAQLVEIKQVNKLFKASDLRPALKSAAEKLSRKSEQIRKNYLPREDGIYPEALADLSATNQVVIQAPWSFIENTENPDQPKIIRSPEGVLMMDVSKNGDGSDYKELSLLMGDVLQILNSSPFSRAFDGVRITDLEGNLIGGFWRPRSGEPRVDHTGQKIVPGQWAMFTGIPRYTFSGNEKDTVVQLDFIEVPDLEIENP